MNSDLAQDSDSEIAVAEKKAYAVTVRSSDPSSLEPQADVGVLLVHGIGNHREGVTLRAFGQPMLDWLKEWLRGRGAQAARGNVNVTQTRFNDIASPAYSVAEITTVGSDPVTTPSKEQWLFCEGWWGAIVQSPASLRLLKWMWTRGPLLIYWHFYVRQTATKWKAGKWLSAATFASVAFLLAGFTQFVVTIAIVLSLIPIGQWRRKIVKAIRVLTLTLGDSYVLEEDIQRAALIERVRFTFQWLAARTKRVVIIAHSQGGAIAHEMLQRTSLPNQLAMLVTVGSGLEKLRFLREFGDARSGLVAASLVFPLIACGLAMYLNAPSGAHWEQALAMIFVGAGIVMSRWVVYYLRSYKTRLSGDIDSLKVPGLPAWLDIYASEDVVPMNKGSMLENADFVRRHKVYNERSYIRDHVSYFTNFNNCLPRLWILLSPLSRLRLFDDKEISRLVRFAIVHRIYAHGILVSRLALLLGLFLGAFALRDSLLDFGCSILTAVEGTAISNWLKPIRAAASFLSMLVKRLWKTDLVSADAVANAFFGAAILLIVIALWWLIFRGLWRARCRARWQKVCSGGDTIRTVRSYNRVLIGCVVFTMIGCMPLIVSIILTISPEFFTIDRIGMVIGVALSGVACLIAFFVAGMLPWLIDAAWRNRHTGWVLAPITTPIILIWWVIAWLSVARWLWPTPIDLPVQTVLVALLLLITAIAGQVYGTGKMRDGSIDTWTALLLLFPAVATIAGVTRWAFAYPWFAAAIIYLASTVLVLGAGLWMRLGKIAV